MTKVHHDFGPYYHQDSKILILGSFPSVKSREVSFYYGHPQNRFWKVLSAVLNVSLPVTLQEKKDFLKVHQIALWDVIESCEIKGSSDASITHAIPVDLMSLLENSSIEKILINGKTAEKLYVKYFSDVKIPYVSLPSTSPANAAWSLNDLISAYGKSLICCQGNDSVIK